MSARADRRLRVLLGTELGGGLGHVAMALQLAETFAARGWEPVIACPDPARVATFPGAGAHRVLQGLCVQRDPAYGGDDYLAQSYADVLAWWGYGDATRLTGYLHHWQSLLRRVAPDVVVAEYAPALCLALRGDARLLAIGNGFCLPPGSGDRFPALVGSATPLRPQQEVLSAIETALAACALPALERLPSLHGADALVTALPQLDPYFDLRGSPPVGPVDVALERLPLASGARWFAYLDARRACTAPVLRILSRMGMPGAVYLGGSGWEGIGLHPLPGIDLHQAPPPYGRALAPAAFVVHHGSAGLAQAALAAGRPQLVLPTDLEKRIYGRMLATMGVARVLDGRYGVGDVEVAIAHVQSRQSLTNAEACAAGVERAAPWRGAEAVVDACERRAREAA